MNIDNPIPSSDMTVSAGVSRPQGTHNTRLPKRLQLQTAVGAIVEADATGLAVLLASLSPETRRNWLINGLLGHRLAANDVDAITAAAAGLKQKCGAVAAHWEEK